MVRLVFRPYPQVWRSICTSESLRASTRVSSGFALLKHSSPSFGSQHICSYSNLSRSRIGRSMVRPPRGDPTSVRRPSLSLCRRVSITLRLAHMSDSLVRVSRRVAWNHMTANDLGAFVPVEPICQTYGRTLHAVNPFRPNIRPGGQPNGTHRNSSAQPEPVTAVYNTARRLLPFCKTYDPVRALVDAPLGKVQYEMRRVKARQSFGSVLTPNPTPHTWISNRHC